MYKYLNNKNNDDAFYQNILRKGIHTSHLYRYARKELTVGFTPEYICRFMPTDLATSIFAHGTRQLFVKIKLNIIRNYH